MKAVILAGGLGTRISEESDLRPKPMVEIGGLPIIWHIMKTYSNHGINDFVVLLGYKGHMIKEYFLNYYLHTSNVTLDVQAGKTKVLSSKSENWRVTFLDTGLETETGGRLLKAKETLGDETFCLTYGDGLSDIDLESEIKFHRSHGKLATVAAVKPPSRFATLEIDTDGMVEDFREKHSTDVGWINGGFFVLEPRVLDLISGDDSVWEREPMQSLAHRGELMAFKHSGFWKPMDTLRDKRELESLWRTGSAPWVFQQ